MHKRLGIKSSFSNIQSAQLAGFLRAWNLEVVQNATAKYKPGRGGSHSDRTKSRGSRKGIASGIASDLRLLHVKKNQTREYEVGYKKYGLILK